MQPPKLVAAALAGSLVLASASSLGALTAEAQPPEGTPVFNRTATIAAAANLADPNQEAVAEISTVSGDLNTLISTDAEGRLGMFDITDPFNPQPAGLIELGGEPTSVFATGGYLLVVIDDSDGDFVNPSGRVVVLSEETREELATIELPGQPDSIDVTPDGQLAAIAIENQRDEEATPPGGEEGDLPQPPPGSVVFIDLVGEPADWTADELPLPGLDQIVEPSDPEPEYVKFSPDGSSLALTLQENNAVVIIDSATKSVRTHFNVGDATVTGIDTTADENITFDSEITKPREPDAIGWIDDDNVAIANEGDWRGGTRGWTIFAAATGEIVWDAGNTFEYLAIEHGTYPEFRADKKGTEPEGLAVATYGDTRYAFVGSERGNFIAVYIVDDPTAPEFVQLLPTTRGPEGLLPIPERNLFVVASEADEVGGVRAGVQIYELEGETPIYPEIKSAVVDGKPIPWGALGSLAADPVDAGTLWTVTDSAFRETRILKIDVDVIPAVITEALPVTDGEGPVGLDAEGIWAAPDGTFWLGVEGAEGPENELVHVGADGVIVERVALPDVIAERYGKNGIEGVTGDNAGGLYVAMQRTAEGDPENTARIGRYDLAAGTWSWYLYPLETTETPDDWIGLSEITWLGDGRVAVIERDKQSGPAAKVKRVYQVQLPAVAAQADPVPVEKELLYDVLPDLQIANGWVQEKLEGFAVGTDGFAYAITDNDALVDNTGETQFLRLGQLAEPTPEPTPTGTPPTSDPSGTPPTAEPSGTPPSPAPSGTPPTAAPTGTQSPDPSAPTSPGSPVPPGPVPPGPVPPGPVPPKPPLAETGASLGIAALGAALLTTVAGLIVLGRRRS